MVVEEIDLYWLKAEEVAKYLPEGGCGEAKDSKELAMVLVERKRKAIECSAIDVTMAEAIDGVLSVDIRLP
jgi:hypothetical protein